LNPHEEFHRPGVSDAFLRDHGIRHVTADEANRLVGYHVPGLLIPYFRYFTSGNSEALKVNGKPFYRLRLDAPRPDGPKYLSPRGGGCQLFQTRRPPLNKRTLVIAEGEIKACALAEAGIPVCAINGICGACPGGQLLPELARLLEKYRIEQVFFLGDADTAFLYEFSCEVCKLANALPEGCDLLLPRIPLNMPNGIDDCIEKLGGAGGKFLAWWQQLTTRRAILVGRGSSDPNWIAF
jgi:hypothetical protein